MLRTSFDRYWAFRPRLSPFLELAGESQPWTSVTLPHDAMLDEARSAEGLAATGYFPSGVYEYRKQFVVPEELRGGRVTLEFEGAYRDAMVYVNGDFVGQRPYGYSQFFVDIDHVVAFGAENEVRVETRAHADSRWYTGAGLYRRTWLLTGAGLHVVPEGVTISTPDIDAGSAVVVVRTQLGNHGSPTMATVLTEVVHPDGHVLAHDAAPTSALTGTTVATQRLRVETPLLWDVEAPHLYSCRTSLIVDEEVLEQQTTTFGIRSLELDSTRGLRINGSAVTLRGACIHHDNGPIGAATVDRAEERRVQVLKAAGFNALRSAHNPMSTAMLNACDRLGMLVIDEAFDAWTTSKTDHDYALHFPQWWRADLEAMVSKDRNHPSVVMYSIGNEITEIGTPAGADRTRQLAEAVRAADPTRYVTIGVNGLLVAGQELFASFGAAPSEDVGINTQMTTLEDYMPLLLQSELVGRKTEAAFAVVDVAGYNYMDSRYELDGKKYPQRVIVGSETHPAEIDRLWALVEQHDHVIGDFTWTGWDYLGEAGIGRIAYDDDVVSEEMPGGLLGGYPWLTAWCGDIDITGNRRPVSFYREIVFGRRHDPYLAVQRPERHGQRITHSSGWAWSDVVSGWTWPGYEQSEVVVEVYSDADEVELLMNGTSMGRLPVGPDARFRAEFPVVYAPGELTAVAYRKGDVAGRSSLRTADGPRHLLLAIDRDEVRSDGSDLAHVTISVADPQGTVDGSEDHVLTVDVDGNAELMGFASGDPRADLSFRSGACRTFEGRALAVVRPLGPGPVTVRITTPRLAPQQISFHGV